MTNATTSCVLHVVRDRDHRLVGWVDADGQRLPFSGVLDLIAVVERLADLGGSGGSRGGVQRS